MHSCVFCISDTNSDDIYEHVDLNDDCEHWGADYVRESDDRDADIEWLKSVSPELDIEKEADSRVCSFELTKQAKMDYFEKQFDKLTEFLKDMSLEEFATNGFKAWEMKEAIDGQCGFHVYEDGCIETFDMWIRYAKEGKYYIGATYDYHM